MQGLLLWVAQVYKANWKGTTVAVKVLNDNSDCQRLEFVREANMLQALRYPNVVSYLGCAISDQNEVCCRTPVEATPHVLKASHDKSSTVALSLQVLYVREYSVWQ